MTPDPIKVLCDQVWNNAIELAAKSCWEYAFQIGELPRDSEVARECSAIVRKLKRV